MTCKNRNCDKETQGRHFYCSDHCRYWELQMRKDDNKGKPIKKYQNNNYFAMAVSCSLGGSQQGKRSGNMIKGGMSSVVSVNETIVPLTLNNLKTHFSMSGIKMAYLCGGGRISRTEFLNNTFCYELGGTNENDN